MSSDDPEDEGVREQRGQEFFLRMGLPNGNFSAGVLAPALRHALAATRDAPGRPWVPYGARNIGGRVRGLAQDPTDARLLYAGSALSLIHISEPTRLLSISYAVF